MAESLVTHFGELRRRLIAVVLIFTLTGGLLFLFREPLLTVLTAPLEVLGAQAPQLITLSVTEIFFVYLKLAAWGALFVTMPVMIWQLWRFIAPALYTREKAVVMPLLVATPMLFYAGGILVYYLVMPAVLQFFLSFGFGEVDALLSLKAYLGLFIQLVFAFGLAFELPILIMVLIMAGVVQPAQVIAFRKYAYVIIVLFAAVLTPPDPASQLMLAAPMIALYELTLLRLYRMKKDNRV